MSSVTTKPMSAGEFFDWCHREENRDRRFELEAGVVREYPLTGEREGFVCSNACGILGTYFRKQRTGYVCANGVGLILERNPDTVLGPAVTAFVDKRRFDQLNVGYCERLPALAVDMLSDWQSPTTAQNRVNRYLKSGIAMVWLVDSDNREVIIHVPNQQPITRKTNAEVTGFGVLPDFCCKVSDFFAMPGNETW